MKINIILKKKLFVFIYILFDIIIHQIIISINPPPPKKRDTFLILPYEQYCSHGSLLFLLLFPPCNVEGRAGLCLLPRREKGNQTKSRGGGLDVYPLPMFIHVSDDNHLLHFPLPPSTNLFDTARFTILNRNSVHFTLIFGWEL